MELEKFEATPFLKKILRQNPNLKNVLIGLFEIMEESGNWKFDKEPKAEL
jgi:hypothetical protein